MKAAKPEVIYARRKARQGKLDRADFTPYSNNNDSNASTVFNPHGSETDIPLTTSDQPYQQWDSNGRAVGYAGDPRLHAPEPQRAQARPLVFQETQPYGGGGIGTSYPQGGTNTGGRSPLRQESSDTVDWEARHREGARDTFDLPRVSSPGTHEPLHDPFEPTPPTSYQTPYAAPLGPPPGAAPSTAPAPFAQSSFAAQTPTAQFANYHPPPAANSSVTSPPLPNPFADQTPTQFTHPQALGHAPEATDTSFYTADGHSRVGTEEPSHPATGRTFSPPPPSYRTDSLR